MQADSDSRWADSEPAEMKALRLRIEDLEKYIARKAEEARWAESGALPQRLPWTKERVRALKKRFSLSDYALAKLIDKAPCVVTRWVSAGKQVRTVDAKLWPVLDEVERALHEQYGSYREAARRRVGRMAEEELQVAHAKAWDGLRLEVLRQRLGMTQERFAQRVGISVTTLQRWYDRGASPSYLPRLVELEASLG